MSPRRFAHGCIWSVSFAPWLWTSVYLAGGASAQVTPIQGSQYAVPHAPQFIATAVGAGELGSGSVRTLRSVARPIPPQFECELGTQCPFCVDRVCCLVAACPARTFCNVPGREGRCSAPLTPTPQAAASILLTTPTGTQGDVIPIEVTLHTGGTAVAGIQNDIRFDLGAAIVATTSGRPDCAANPSINKYATSFAFRPSGCTPRIDCTAIRALVLSTDNVDPIPDGALLYTCAVRIGDETPPGSYPLAVSGEIASDPDGNQVAFTGVDGAVIVTTAPGATPRPTWTVSPTPSPKPPTATSTPFPTSTRTPTHGPTHTPRPSVAVSVGAATAGPGDSVVVGLTLTSGTYPVAGVQDDVILGSGIAVAAKLNGKPDCAVNPDINKPATAFSFLPFNCQPGVSCTGMRALVLAVDNVDPIPDGAVLYTCRVQVDSHAPPGMYRLLLLGAVASDPTGEAWSIVLNNGGIDVVTPPGATPVPTWTPGPVLVAVPPAAPKNPPGASAVSSGCTMAGSPPRRNAEALMLLLPAAWRRRRRAACPPGGSLD